MQIKVVVCLIRYKPNMIKGYLITVICVALFIIDVLSFNAAPLAIERGTFHLDDQDFSYAHYIPEHESNHVAVVCYPLTMFEEACVGTLKQLQTKGFHTWAIDNNYRDAYGTPVRSYSGWFASSEFADGQARSHIDDFGTFVQDLKHFIGNIIKPKEDDGKQYSLLGSSAGANVIVRYLQESDMAKFFTKTVLIVPMLGINEFPWYKRMFVYGAYALGFHRCYPPGLSDMHPDNIVELAKDPHNTSTSNTDSLRDFAEIVRSHRDKVHGGPTIGWIVAAHSSCAEIFQPEKIARIRNKEILIVKAAGDTTVSLDAIDKFSDLMARAQVRELDGRHYIHLEQQDTVTRMYEAIFSFLPKPYARYS